MAFLNRWIIIWWPTMTSILWKPWAFNATSHHLSLTTRHHKTSVKVLTVDTLCYYNLTMYSARIKCPRWVFLKKIHMFNKDTEYALCCRPSISIQQRYKENDKLSIKIGNSQPRHGESWQLLCNISWHQHYIYRMYIQTKTARHFNHCCYFAIG